MKGVIMPMHATRHNRQKPSYPARKRTIKAYCKRLGVPWGQSLKHSLKAARIAHANFQSKRQDTSTSMVRRRPESRQAASQSEEFERGRDLAVRDRRIFGYSRAHELSPAFYSPDFIRGYESVDFNS